LAIRSGAAGAVATAGDEGDKVGTAAAGLSAATSSWVGAPILTGGRGVALAANTASNAHPPTAPASTAAKAAGRMRARRTGRGPSPTEARPVGSSTACSNGRPRASGFAAVDGARSTPRPPQQVAARVEHRQMRFRRHAGVGTASYTARRAPTAMAWS
jgi:hypothetical protein